MFNAARSPHMGCIGSRVDNSEKARSKGTKRKAARKGAKKSSAVKPDEKDQKPANPVSTSHAAAIPPSPAIPKKKLRRKMKDVNNPLQAPDLESDEEHRYGSMSSDTAASLQGGASTVNEALFRITSWISQLPGAGLQDPQCFSRMSVGEVDAWHRRLVSMHERNDSERSDSACHRPSIQLQCSEAELYLKTMRVEGNLRTLAIDEVVNEGDSDMQSLFSTNTNTAT